MGQPDGSLYAVGAPFYGYKNPISAFGKKRRVRRYNVAGSQCNQLSERICKGNPNCTYTRNGCRRRSGTATTGVVYEGPSLQFGKKRRSAKCKRVTKLVCKRRKSKRRNSKSKPNVVVNESYREPASGYSMSGDDDIGAYAEAAGISFFGRRRRRSRRCRR